MDTDKLDAALRYWVRNSSSEEERPVLIKITPNGNRDPVKRLLWKPNEMGGILTGRVTPGNLIRISEFDQVTHVESAWKMREQDEK